jgi:hypothetical protein
VRHHETVPHVSWLRRYGWFVFNPAHIATIGLSIVFAMTLPAALDVPLTWPGGALAWGIPGVCLAGIVWTVAVTWWMTRPNRFEPRSEVTSACAISHDLGQFFEGRRHIYAFRSQAFADAFARANQSRVWTERDQSRMWKKSLVATVLLVVVIGGARLLLWYYEGR